MGGGPVFLYPSATDNALGGQKWGVGPTVVLLKQKNGWTYGTLANHIESFAGTSSRENVSATFLQPFLSYTTKTYTTYGINTESTYDWQNNRLPTFILIGIKLGLLPSQLLPERMHIQISL